MFKKKISIVILIIMCINLLLSTWVCASNTSLADKISVWVLDNEFKPVTGKIPKEQEFYVAAYLNDNSIDISFSVYCAVFDKNGMVTAYKGAYDKNASYAGVQCSIPEQAGDDYYIKIFVWQEETLAPLYDMIAFNASSAYETYSPKDGLYTGKEVLKDASFENDNMINDGWDARHACRITRSEDYVFDGSYSCKVEERNNYYDSIKQTVTEPLNKSGSGTYLIKYNVLPLSETERNFRFITVMYDAEGNKIVPETNSWDDLYIYGAVNGTWNSLSAYVNITIPQNLHSAQMYIETNDGNEDFYVDNCSVKKLLTHEEYLKDNPPSDYSTSGLKEYLEVINAYKASNLLSVYPKNSDAVLKNPYKGLNYYTTKLDFSSLDLTGDGSKYANVVYHRVSWKSLEPEEGNYNFDVIEQNIEKLKEHNMMLGIGIGSCINYNGYNNSANSQNVPDWLYDDYNIPYTLQEVGDGSVANTKVYTDELTGKQYIKVPVFNNEIFIEKMQNFMDAFALRFNNNPNIAYVDMRSYGNWGEWHFSSFNDVIKNHSYYDENNTLQTYTTEDFNKLVDVYKNIKLPLAMFTSRIGQLNYAVEKYNTGVRVDGNMNPHLSDEHRKMTFIDGKSFSVAEWFYQPEVYYAGGDFEAYADYMPIFLEKMIKEGKVSYTSVGYWNPEDFYTRFPDLVCRIANKTGYWLKASKITYPQKLTDGLFAMTIKNDGATQLYAGYKRNAGVKLALADESGAIIDTLVLDGVNPEDWKAGKYSFVAKNYAFDNTLNAAKLYLGIFSDKDNETPDIKLGIDEATVNGWYDVTGMVSNTYKSDNKLYFASLPYADYNYGYREPYYAFDNSDDTFWASEIRKDEFLEIDFGEYVTVNKMMLNALEAVSVNYSVVGFNGKEWIKLYTSQSLASGENIVLLSENTVSKVRLVFNQSSTDIIKINKMYID